MDIDLESTEDPLAELLSMAKQHNRALLEDPIAWAVREKHTINGFHPVEWAIMKKHKIAGQNPAVWAMSNDIQVPRTDLLSIAVVAGEKIGGVNPLVYAIEKNLNIGVMDPVYYALTTMNYSKNKEMLEYLAQKKTIKFKCKGCNIHWMSLRI